MQALEIMTEDEELSLRRNITEEARYHDVGVREVYRVRWNGKLYENTDTVDLVNAVIADVKKGGVW